MKLVMKYSTHLLTLFTACLCVWGALNWGALDAIQKVSLGFAVLITLHEWEEMHWPGGFMDLMAGMLGFTMDGVAEGAQHTSQSLMIALIVALPVAFPQQHWLFCGCMAFGMVEGVMHVAGIRVARTERPYTPGMVTAIVMFVYCVAAIALVYGQVKVAALSWVAGFGYFIAWFFVMEQLLITLCGFDRRAIMRNMLASFTGRR